MPNKKPLALIISLCVVAAMLLTACQPNNNNNQSGEPTALPADALRVVFTYGSEKDNWIQAATARFLSNNPKTSQGKRIIVDPQPVGSGESMDDILQGRVQPALWSPASRFWLPQINDAWATQNGKNIIDEDECRDLVLSPVVIMMWRPMAEALGWPDKQIGWADLAKLATAPDGWASVGAPQFGAFRFGHTHPDFSNSGLQAITAFVYAATVKQRGLTVADVQADATLQFLRDIESRVSHYGRSTGFFGSAMAQRGTQYLSAAVVYESVVVENNTNAVIRNRLDFPLVAIYPKEGTFQSDHPACIPDAPWMSDELKEAAKIYRDYLLSQAEQQQALTFGFRPANPAIAIGDPLMLANGVDPSQPKNTLSVPNAATIRAIREAWQQNKRGVNITMLIDISGSMREEDRIIGARDGAKAFIDQLDPADQLTLIIFDNTQDVLLENVVVGDRREDIKRTIDGLIPRGGTALFDSIAFTIDRMKRDPNRINALVVLTDGQDRDSRTYRDANILMDKYGMGSENSSPDISIFTIGYGSDADRQALTTIAERGRGAYRAGGTADIRNIYLDISTFF
jgi:Ca-activated chloride channel homolog